MAKATNTTYQWLTDLYIRNDLEVTSKDAYLLKSLSIELDQFKNYVDACKKANAKREEWIKG